MTRLFRISVEVLLSSLQDQFIWFDEPNICLRMEYWLWVPRQCISTYCSPKESQFLPMRQHEHCVKCSTVSGDNQESNFRSTVLIWRHLCICPLENMMQPIFLCLSFLDNLFKTVVLSLPVSVTVLENINLFIYGEKLCHLHIISLNLNCFNGKESSSNII